jgi:AmmeMemoRadiSam system protein B
MDGIRRTAYGECRLLRSTMPSNVRPPAVAGAFYPSDPVRLDADVRGYLAAAQPVDPDFRIRILIVPHAGYVYSGPVAATGYRLVEPMDHIRRIVMFGPSHYVWFTGLALPEADLLDTPLGAVAVDADAVARVADNPLVTRSVAAHEREHSLEVQLPFLQVVAPEIPVVPFLTGDVDPARAADAVEPLLDEGTLLLVSSDLSHYRDAATARRLDAETASSIEQLDPGALGRESACGRTGVQAALLLARRSDYRVQILDLRNSSDTAGPADRVVGYGTFVIGS